MSTPLSYLSGFGPKAAPVVALTWGLLGISITVVLVVTGLVLAGCLRRREPGSRPIDAVPVERGGDGLRWLWIGVGVSCVPLLIALVWTMQVLAAVSGPGRTPPLTIEVTAAQWWWKARYLDPNNASRVFITANEIHIPVGQPVQLRLISTDVIHSFWVPALGGKTDVIPGQTNVTWMEAGVAGRFRGTCGEFCGLQHAHMGIDVVADPPEAFRLWEAQQIAPAPPPATPAVAAGEATFVYHCGACHTVRGSAAGGSVAPDLTHIMSRSTLAAVTLPHTIATLSAWVVDPQAVKPGTHMPNLEVSGPELQSLRNYLATLK